MHTIEYHITEVTVLWDSLMNVFIFQCRQSLRWLGFVGTYGPTPWIIGPANNARMWQGAEGSGGL